MLLKLTSLQVNIQDFEMRIITKKIKALKEKKEVDKKKKGVKRGRERQNCIETLL